jgi:hypothetical protein
MQIGVLLGDGDGTFQPLVGFTITSGVNLGLGLVADLNSDKAPDLVSINGDGTISVLLNSGTDFSISASKPTPETVSLRRWQQRWASGTNVHGHNHGELNFQPAFHDYDAHGSAFDRSKG